MPSTYINTSVNGDNVIVPASAGQAIVVYGFLVTSESGGGAAGTWISGTASAGSNAPLCGIGSASVAGGGAVLPIPPRDEWFRTAEGEALNLNCAVTLTGVVRWSYYPLVVPTGNPAGA